MGKIILENVTPDEIGQKLQDAGVRPGERVTIEVTTAVDRFLESAAAVAGEVESKGFTDEDLIELLELKPGEFENLYGRPPVRRAADLG
jgi:hypothetical protein